MSYASSVYNGVRLRAMDVEGGEALPVSSSVDPKHGAKGAPRSGPVNPVSHCFQPRSELHRTFSHFQIAYNFIIDISHPRSHSFDWQVATLLRNVDPKVLQAAGAIAAIVILLIGFKVSFTLVLVLSTCIGMLGFASFLANWVLSKDEGTADMQDVSNAIRDGAEGYFATQYGTIGRLAAYLCAGIFIVYLFRTETPEQAAAGISKFTLAVLTAFSFLLGAGCSGVAGYVGMWVSVRANVRVAGAARRSAREALVVALRAGGFSGMIVVALMVLGLALLYSLLHLFYVSFGGLSDADVPLLMVGYGFGASFVALCTGGNRMWSGLKNPAQSITNSEL